MKQEKPTKFTYEFKEDDGVISIWKYDLDRFRNGPILVENKYPPNYKAPQEKLKTQNKKLPKNKQKFINPSNGKLISYQRAKQLKIIK